MTAKESHVNRDSSLKMHSNAQKIFLMAMAIYFGALIM